MLCKHCHTRIEMSHTVFVLFGLKRYRHYENGSARCPATYAEPES